MTIPIGIQGSHFSQPPTVGTYVAGFKVEGTTATTLSITQTDMGTVTSGNMLVAFVFSFVDSKSGSYLGLPSGFTQRVNVTGADRNLKVGTKVAGGSEGTYTTSAGASVFESHFHLVEVSGVTAFSVASSVGPGVSNNIAIPSVNSTPGGFIVGHYFWAIDGTISSSAGTNRLQKTTATSTLTFTDQMASSGATGTYTGTPSPTNTTYRGGAFVVLN